MNYYNYSSSDTFRRFYPIVIAGMAGGMAEILWITFYGFFSAVDLVEVARQVSVTVIPATADSNYAPALGLLIHLLLSVALAATFSYTALLPLYRRFGSQGVFLGSLLTLALVWKMNFFLVLPLINASFISVVPLFVTLISKLSFGAAMAAVLLVMRPMRAVAHVE
ncbi:MAG TPA: hypothetical protein VIV20_05730 [Gammaproteobacteria bacterium]